jgi:methionyl-tRNA formyltransferase
MATYLLVSEKEWHKPMFIFLREKMDDDTWVLIDKKRDFTVDKLNSLNPDTIFIPHWSYIIPSQIYEKYECIVFHMTDLPFGRGGSPLQNLIVRGISETKITAIKVEKGLDTGDYYLKEPLNLGGTAKEIFLRSRFIIQKMIEEIIEKDLRPKKQEGEITEFKRRTPKEGNLENLEELEKVFDYIRMLDCEGYPPAFIENENFRFEFTRASLKTDKELIADVRIIKK